MSEVGLNLLVEAELLTSSGAIIDITRVSDEEINRRISYYINARIQTSEVEALEINRATDNKLSALFSTGSTEITKKKLLSNALVYDSIVIDDPIVSPRDSVFIDDVEKGIKLYSWAFELIKAGFVKILPISYFNGPSSEIPLLSSDDQFRSDIPPEIHDFIHQHVRFKSVMKNHEGRMLILNEDAFVKRRPSLFLEFHDDYWVGGPNSYLFQTLDNPRRDQKGNMVRDTIWNHGVNLDKEKFKHWSYQCVNQAMRARLRNIYNESCLADELGHTYVTESNFEANILSMSGLRDNAKKCKTARFLEANNKFIEISSPGQIIELRSKYSQAFERFSHSLLSISEELSNTDPEEFDQKSNLLFMREIMPQVDAIRDNASSVYSSALKGGFISFCGIAAAIQTGSVVPLVPALMLGIAGGLSEAIPEVSKMQRLKKKPAFIWHKVTKA